MDLLTIYWITDIVYLPMYMLTLSFILKIVCKMFEVNVKVNVNVNVWSHLLYEYLLYEGN